MPVNALLNSGTMDVRHLSSGILWFPEIPASSAPCISHFLVSIFYALYFLESGKQTIAWNMQAYPALIFRNISCSGTCILHFLYPTFYELLNSGTMDVRHLSSGIAIYYSGIISTLFRCRLTYRYSHWPIYIGFADSRGPLNGTVRYSVSVHWIGQSGTL